MSRLRFARFYFSARAVSERAVRTNRKQKTKMKKYLIAAAVAALTTAWAGSGWAQSDAPYTEGSVWQVTMIKTKPGMSDDYLKGLAKSLKTILEEEKKQGLIVSYKLLLGPAATPGD